MLYFVLLFLSAFLIGLTALVLVYRPFRARNKYILYGSVAVGNTLFVLFINGISYVVGIRGSTLVAPALGFAVFAFAWLISLNFREEIKTGWVHLKETWSDGKERRFGLFLAAAFIVVFLALLVFYSTSHDPKSHHAQLATIAGGNFPVMTPNQPDTPLAYHYGFALFAAFPLRATGWDINIVEDICLLWIMFGAVLSVVGFVKIFFSEHRKSRIMGLLFYFFGYGPLWICGLLYFSGLFSEWLPGHIGPVSVLSYSNSFLRRAPAMAYAVMPALLWMWRQFFQTSLRWPIAQAILIGGLMGALGLMTEEVVFLVGTAVAIVLFKDWWKKHTPWTKIVVLIIIFLCVGILCIIQGGIPTQIAQTLHKGADVDLPGIHTVKSLRLIWPPGVPAFTGYGHAFSSTFWRVLFLEFGPLFLLFPYFLRPRGDSFKQVVYLMCWLGFLIPAFFTFGPDQFNMQRFSQPSVYLAYLYAGHFIVTLSETKISSLRFRNFVFVVLTIVTVLTPILHGTHRIVKEENYVSVPSEAEAIVQDAKTQMPTLSRVLTISDFHYPFHREGYFAIYDTPPDLFWLAASLKEQHDISLSLLPREKILTWRPGYLLVRRETVEHFQRMLPEAEAYLIKTYEYQDCPLLFVSVEYPSL